MSDEMHTPIWRTRGGVVLCGFLIVSGFYLLTWHTAHVLGVLPLLLLAACPLMHMFMHHGHGHGGHGTPQPSNRDDADKRSMS
jgi:hypothetical protein